MSSQIPKDRTIAALAEVWASIGGVLADLADEEWLLPTHLPGWDVRDNVAHIVGIEEMLLGNAAPAVEIDRDANPHVRNDIGESNEVWVESLRHVAPSDVRERFRRATGSRLAALESMTETEWNATAFTPAGRSTYGRFMQIRVFDCWLHEQDIRDATGRPGHEAGLAVDVTLDEMRTALGYVVGKKAGAVDGQSVTFALTDGGVVVREIHVVVDGRAGVVDTLPGPATTTLTMPVGVMTRRCAGRVPLDVDDPRIAIEGDVRLAEQILRNQSYTL